MFVRADAERRAHPDRKPLRCTGAMVVQLTAQAARAGVPIDAGTDFVAPAGVAWPEVHDEIFFLVRDVGMTPAAAIRSATLVGARAAGRDGETGTVTPGKLADFVVLARDPLADIANIESVVTVVKRGRAFPREDYRQPTSEEIRGR